MARSLLESHVTSPYGVILLNQAVLTPEQVAFYREHEYLILRQVVPEALLQGAQAAIERWVDALIEHWRSEGKLTDPFRGAPFHKRLMLAWNAAGKPPYNPNPTLEIVGREMYDILRYPLFIQIAQQLFESPNVTASGIFHCRPNLPEQAFTDTPWHQDGQCCPSLAGTKFMVMWTPLMDVDEHNACLQAAIGRQHQGKLYPRYKDPAGYYIAMRPRDVKQLHSIETLRMQRGDLLFFNEMLPHRAIPNHSDAIRWSIDMRYYESANSSVVSASRSFICADADPARVEDSYEEWLRRMHTPIN